MARLKRAPESISRLPVRLKPADATEASLSRRRYRTEPWRKWYHLARWAAKPHGVRWQQLVSDGFTCRACGGLCPDSQLVCDHILDHKGDWDAFWSGPFQTLCLTCHGRKARTPNEYRAGGG